MGGAFKVLLIAQDGQGVVRVAERLPQVADWQIVTRHYAEGLGADTVTHSLGSKPDLIIADLPETWEPPLVGLDALVSALNVPLILLGDAGHAPLLRRAMQIGARDLLDHAVSSEELTSAVRKVASERPKRISGGTKVVAMMNVKGGSGASFVATSLAHALAQQWQQRVALIDMDLQFGSLDLTLDVKPKNSLLHAISQAEQLDETALQAYMSEHSSGVCLLGAYNDGLPLPWEVSTEGLKHFMGLARESFDRVIVDLPRSIDPLSTTVLDQADLICLVMDQGLIHLRDARLLLGILTHDLGVMPEQIRIVVNRYQPTASVGLSDIQKALGVEHLVLIPNDYQRATQAINLGIPIHSSAPNAPVAKAIVEFAASIMGQAPKKAGLGGKLKGLFGR